MKFLNLDPDFAPLGESIAFERFTFNGGEPHIRILDSLNPDDELSITHRVQAFNDVGSILMAKDALDRMGLEKIHLFLPYFPGARQDRLMTTGEPLSVKVYADLFNTANFKTITILDPHSDVSPALINQVRVLNNLNLVRKGVQDLQDYVLIAPDGGALKKVYHLAKMLGGIEVIECSKSRNPINGKLKGFKVYADDLKGRTGILVDDICDGGGTFLGLAEALKEKNIGPIVLIVTHGIFSKGTEALKEHFEKIICTDSFKTIKDKNIIQIELKNILAQSH